MKFAIYVFLASVFFQCGVVRTGLRQSTGNIDTSYDKRAYNTIIQYQVYNDKLVPYEAYETPSEIDGDSWEKEKKQAKKHGYLFSLFADLIPAEYRKGIQYFSVFDATLEGRSFGSLSTYKRTSFDRFCLNLNRNILTFKDRVPFFKAPGFGVNTLGYDILTYTFIHEFGHYITLNNSQAYLEYDTANDTYATRYKLGSFVRGIRDLTWKKLPQLPKECLKPGLTLYNCMPGHFVSAYAAKFWEEDAAESFAHFILREDKPKGGATFEDKILLFYNDPSMLDLRKKIRKNLERKKILPASPNYEY